MRVGSLFTGVGGFDLGLERGGHEIVWQVEYDKQCRAVLRRHWPDVDLYEDVRNVGGLRCIQPSMGNGDPHTTECGGRGDGRPSTDNHADGRRHARTRTALAPVDLICGGFPCQDLSVAGRRAGLDGERSGLWFEFRRIVSELAPTWVLIENVFGLLSSNEGRDLAVILRGLEELGYVGAWRTLDSQYLGVAQRRRRVFVLACRDPRAGCPAEVLAIAEGMSGHPAPSREAGARVATSFTERTRGEGRRLEHASDIAYALDNPGDGGRTQTRLVAAPITAREQKGPDSDATSGFVLAHTLRADGLDASEDGTGRGMPIVADPLCANEQRTYTHEGSTFRLRNVVPYRKAQKAHDPDDCERWEEADYANTLNGQGDTAGTIAAHTIPRRLTPTECERLQGFPDGWTENQADGPRYRQMGNAVTVNVAEWIGRRLPNPKKKGAKK